MTNELVFSSLVMRTPLSKAATADVVDSPELEPNGPPGPFRPPASAPPRREERELVLFLRLLDELDEDVLEP